MKRVDQAGAELVIDGAVVRPIEMELTTPGTQQARKRGGLRHRRRRT